MGLGGFVKEGVAYSNAVIATADVSATAYVGTAVRLGITFPSTATIIDPHHVATNEDVTITNIVGDTLTITRGASPQTFPVGAIIVVRSGTLRWPSAGGGTLARLEDISGSAAIIVGWRREGVLVGTRPYVNFHEGSGITITMADDPGNTEVDITIASSITFATPSVEVLSDASSFDAGSGTNAMRANARLIADTAAPGVLTIDNGADIGTSTALSRADHRHGFPNGVGLDPTIRTSPIFTGSTTTIQLTSGNTHALYMGRASRANPTVSIKYTFVGTGMSGITWFEMAIATGTPVYGGPATLTTRGYVDASGSGTAGTFYSVTVTTSGIAYGDDIWVLGGYNATGRGSFAASGTDRAHGLYALATARPSTMGAGTSFTASALAVAQWMMAES